MIWSVRAVHMQTRPYEFDWLIHTKIFFLSFKSVFHLQERWLCTLHKDIQPQKPELAPKLSLNTDQSHDSVPRVSTDMV